MNDLLTEPLSRVLDSSEAYYQLLERHWPVNLLCAVDLAADAESVRSAWAGTVDRMPVLGASVRVRGGRPEVVFGGRGGAEIWRTFATVEEAVAAQAAEPLDANRVVARCALVERGDGCTAVLAAHHSLVDGRGMAQIALTLGALAAGEAPADQPLFRPTVSLESVVEVDVRRRRRELLVLAREIRSEESYVDNSDRLTWHDPAVGTPRDLACALFQLDAGSTAGLLKRARAVGATVYGLICAAVLRSCAELSPGAGRLALSTAVDLRAAGGLPADAPIGQAATLIAGSYDTTMSDEDLARAISTGVHRRIARGEAELLFALSGADRMCVGPESDDVVLRWTAEATPTVCVSNVGVISDPLPSAVRGITIGHAPTPNQSLFFTVTTVRGQLRAMLNYDCNRISIDGDQLAKAIETRLVELAD